MSNSQPAGGRVLQTLVGSLSSGSQAMLSGSHLVNQVPTSSDEPVVPAQTPTTIQSPAPLSEREKLDVFEGILDEVENANGAMVSPPQIVDPPLEPSVLAQAVPVAVTQQASQQPVGGYVGGRQKEMVGGSGLTASAELPGGVQLAEQEPIPEIPPEVESYIQHVEETAKTQPETVVIAPQSDATAAPAITPPRVVRVLPITKEQEEVGLRKNSSFSIRWLVEFGHKLAKMFVGQVVYRE